ncbi:huntingtin-interacting protein K [Macrobrachium rosenbergii]|uniref:huntingtin-interacting protein K-like n=1 Tax=Macrobrachium nipponense TaxID=159736 RepID=UPI0030C84D23
MSQDENHEIEEEVETKSKEKKAAKHDSGAADLERVTNFAEEKEIKSDANFMSVINDVKRQEQTNKLARDQELAKVSIKKEDVEVIMKELEIPKIKAERALREHQGNLIETLVTLTD